MWEVLNIATADIIGFCDRTRQPEVIRRIFAAKARSDEGRRRGAAQTRRSFEQLGCGEWGQILRFTFQQSDPVHRFRVFASSSSSFVTSRLRGKNFFAVPGGLMPHDLTELEDRQDNACGDETDHASHDQDHRRLD